MSLLKNPVQLPSKICFDSNHVYHWPFFSSKFLADPRLIEFFFKTTTKKIRNLPGLESWVKGLNTPMRRRKNPGCGIRQVWVRTLTLSPNHCGTLGKRLCSSESQFPHRQNGHNDKTQLTRLCRFKG